MSGQTIALSLFLVLVAIGAIFFLGIFIVVKRSIARRKSRIGRIMYTPCGIGTPKVWKELINKKINATVKIRTEPRVLAKSEAECSENAENRNLGFKFRAKTVDNFVDLKETIMRSYPELEAPPVRNIRDFLMSARSVAMHSKPSRDLIESYCCLYMRARHDPRPYTEADYFRFLEYHHQMLDLIVVKQQNGSDSQNPTRSEMYQPENKSTSLRTSYFHSPNRLKNTAKTNLEHVKLHNLQKRMSPPVPHHEGTNRFSVFDQPISEPLGSDTSVVMSADLIARTAPTTNRRGSAASDDSQTALICLDPFVDTSRQDVTGGHN